MIPILQKCHNFTGNSNILLYEDFLTEDIINECYSTINNTINNKKYVIKNNNNTFSNKIISINNNFPRLFDKLVVLLQQIIVFNKDDLSLYFNIMNKGCAISRHSDEHVKFSVTIYLNRNWLSDFGGIFQYTTNNNVQKTFIPAYNNLMILKNTPHSVSKINSDKLRITIQGQCKNIIYYKNQIIDNHFYHFTNLKYVK